MEMFLLGIVATVLLWAGIEVVDHFSGGFDWAWWVSLIFAAVIEFFGEIFIAAA